MADGFRRAPNFGGGFARDLAQFQLGANILATPARIEAEHKQAAIDRALLGRMGLSQAEQRTLVPEPPLSLPGGMAGKALSGLGTVGSILTSVLGQPISAPRAAVGQVLQAEALRSGIERRKLLTTTAERVAGATDLDDETLMKELIVDFLRAGDSSQAISLMRQRNKSRAATLNGAISRLALRAAGAPAGTPAGDQAIVEAFASFEGLKAQFREMAPYTGDLPERKAEVDALLAAARATGTQTATRFAETRNNIRAIKDLLPRVRKAVEGRANPDGTWRPGVITATGWLDSLMQGSRLWFTKKSPEVLGKVVFRQDVDQEMIDDIQALQNMTAFAGKFVKGAGIDSGKLAEGDINRALVSFPGVWMNKMQAIAAVNEWEKLVTSLTGQELDEELDVALKGIIKRLGDFAERTSLIGSEASGLTPAMVDDFATPEEGVTGSRSEDRLDKILERMEQKYGTPR